MKLIIPVSNCLNHLADVLDDQLRLLVMDHVPAVLGDDLLSPCGHGGYFALHLLPGVFVSLIDLRRHARHGLGLAMRDDNERDLAEGGCPPVAHLLLSRLQLAKLLDHRLNPGWVGDRLGSISSGDFGRESRWGHDDRNRGRRTVQPDGFHILLKLGFGNRQTAVIIILLSALFSSVAIAGDVLRIPEYYLFFFFMAYFAVYFTGSFFIKELVKKKAKREIHFTTPLF